MTTSNGSATELTNEQNAAEQEGLRRPTGVRLPTKLLDQARRLSKPPHYQAATNLFDELRGAGIASVARHLGLLYLEHPAPGSVSPATQRDAEAPTSADPLDFIAAAWAFDATDAKPPAMPSPSQPSPSPEPPNPIAMAGAKYTTPSPAELEHCPSTNPSLPSISALRLLKYKSSGLAQHPSSTTLPSALYFESAA